MIWVSMSTDSFSSWCPELLVGDARDLSSHKPQKIHVFMIQVMWVVSDYGFKTHLIIVFSELNRAIFSSYVVTYAIN